MQPAPRQSNPSLQQQQQQRAQLAFFFAAALSGAALVGCGDEPVTPVEAEVPPGPPEPFSVLTFNVLCSFCGGDDYDPWEDRVAYFRDLFDRYDADLIGLQELALEFEVDQVLAELPGYGALYYDAVDSNFVYPDATIVYRQDRFEVVEHGFYWLSPTPDEPSSIGFAETQLPRLVAWSHLRDLRSRRDLYFASTHFDNNSPSQELSAPLVLDRTAAWAERMPVVVLGDFNSRPDSEAYATLVGSGGFVNATDIAETVTVESNQSPPPEYDMDQRIDHVLLGGPSDWSCPQWTVDLHVYGPEDRYPSDHRAMYSQLLEQ